MVRDENGHVWLRRTNDATRLWAAGRWLGVLAAPLVWVGYLVNPLAAVRALSEGQARSGPR